MNLTIKIILLAFALLAPACRVCPDWSQPDSDGKCHDDDGECCKVCDNGQACGDTCIGWENTCEAGPGCACQGAAVEDSQ